MRRVGRVLAVIFALVGAVVTIEQLRAQAPAPTPMTTVAVPHVGIIVADIDKASRAFEEVFGINVPKPLDVGPLVFRGTPPADAAASRLKVNMASYLFAKAHSSVGTRYRAPSRSTHTPVCRVTTWSSR